MVLYDYNYRSNYKRLKRKAGKRKAKMPETFAQNKKNILIAPLNWGLGHATRCIPVIQGLLDNGYEPVIASDGIALELLKKERAVFSLAINSSSSDLIYVKRLYEIQKYMIFTKSLKPALE